MTEQFKFTISYHMLKNTRNEPSTFNQARVPPSRGPLPLSGLALPSPNVSFPLSWKSWSFSLLIRSGIFQKPGKCRTSLRKASVDGEVQRKRGINTKRGCRTYQRLNPARMHMFADLHFRFKGSNHDELDLFQKTHWFVRVLKLSIVEARAVVHHEN